MHSTRTRSARRRFHRSAIAIALAAAVAPCLAAGAVDPAAHALDASLEIASGRFSGVLAVGRPGEEPMHHGHVDGHPEPGWSTAFPLASVTKVFTSAAILALHEQGRLALDAPLEQLLPEYAGFPAAQVTIRQLLGHSSGIPSVMQTGHGLDASLDLAALPSPSSLDEQLAPVLPMPLRFAPGTRYEYSNSGYLILGQVLERTTGRPYDEAILGLVLAPLGLADQACFCTDLPSYPDALPREWVNGGSREATLVHPSRSASAGGMRMTPQALVAWLQALADGRVLGPETLAIAWAPGHPTRTPGESMGLGWIVREKAGRTVVLHDGALPGATASIAIDTADRTVAAGLLSPTLPMEHLSSSEDYVRERVVALARGALPDGIPQGPGPAPAGLAGTYRLPDGRGLALVERDGRWQATMAAGGSPLDARQSVRVETRFTAFALRAARAFANGGQAGLLPFASDDLRSNLPPGALDGAFASWAERLGPFASVHAFGTNADETSAHLRFQFERGAVDLGFNFADGKLDGLQLLGESAGDLPGAMDAWITREGKVWLDGYRHASGVLVLVPVLEGGRVTGLSLDGQEAQHPAFPRLP